MNLEDIKEDRKFEYAGCEHTLEAIIDWLIEEVEQSATDQAIAYKRGRADGMVDAVTSCAEIAEKAKYLSDKPWTTDEVAEAIRKEFL